MDTIGTQPQDSGPSASASGRDVSAAVLPYSIETLRNRPDFLRLAHARRQGTPSFMLQARAREDDTLTVRVGFTASKKIGNAVFRNRAKRRMRALIREVLPRLALPGWDYVLVARPQATVSRDYAEMRRDLENALQSVHRSRGT